MIRSSGFVFSSGDLDLFELSDGGDNDVQIVDRLTGNAHFLTPAEAHELASLLHQLADKVEGPDEAQPEPEDFHYADEPQQAVTFQPEETAQEKLKRILDAAASNHFGVI